MAAPRLRIKLPMKKAELAKLSSIAGSRSEPARRVERARMLLAYRKDPSFHAVALAMGVHHQTVQRCIERAAAEGVLVALDERARPGNAPWQGAGDHRRSQGLGGGAGLPQGQVTRLSS